MKIIIAVCFYFCMATLSQAAEQVTSVYENIVLNEDTTWRGSVLVKGSVVVAPQATLRIDPGTVVRFTSSASNQLSNLIIHGRIHAVGTAERPILLTADRSRPARSSWGGIIFLSTEKRNLFERCRIEYAETAIDVRFSTVTLKAVSIEQAQTALMSHDGFVQLASSTISDSETGIEIYNTEFDGKESVISNCQRGCIMNKSSVVFSSIKVMNNKRSGIEAEDCRIKISGGEFSGNLLGARIKGGEGQVNMSRFLKNKETAMHLLGSRIKIQRCFFSENIMEALRLEDGMSLISNNAFTSNDGFNIYNAGRDVISARQNWWGTSDQSTIAKKIHDAADDSSNGVVHIFPWLNEKPPLMP